MTAMELLLAVLLAAASMQLGCAAGADPSPSSALQLPGTDARASVEQSSASNVLAAGGTLRQGQPLSSPDGRVFLVVQPDGNLVLYNALAYAMHGAHASAAIWSSGTAGAPNGPFSLAMQQDCNLVLYNRMGNPPQAAQDAIFATAKTRGGMYDVTDFLPCRLVVTGDGGGAFAVLDTLNRSFFSGGPLSPPGTPYGVLPAAVNITQGTHLYSADATTFLTPQSDGNLVLYNTARYNVFAASAAAAIWAIDSFSPNAPFTLVMQSDCNLVMYDKFATPFTGNQPAYATFATNTGHRGAQPCHLTVSSTGGGLIALSDSRLAQLYIAPSPFQVLLMENPVLPPASALSQAYNVSSGLVSNVTAANPLAGIDTMVLLPTIRAILAVGEDSPGSPVILGSNFSGCALLSLATGAWARTGALRTPRYDFDLKVLFDGSALVTGGTSYPGQATLGSCELYDPSTGTWSYTGSLNAPRGLGVMTLLPSGEVLLAGGFGAAGVTPTAELYRPQARSWAQVGSMATARVDFQLVTLPDGRALAIGAGVGSYGPGPCEVFDPATLAWTPTGSMAVDRVYHVAVVMLSGNVLVAGGLGPSSPVPCYNLTFDQCGRLNSGGPISLNSTEIYNATTGTWSYAADMPSTRTDHSMVTLPSGLVLLTGGYGDYTDGSGSNSSLLYDEMTDTWTPTGSLLLADEDFLSNSAVLFHA